MTHSCTTTSGAAPLTTRADVRGLPAALQQSLLVETCQWLRPGQALEIRLDAEDEARQLLEQRLPHRFSWARSGDAIRVRRTDGLRAEPAEALT